MPKKFNVTKQRRYIENSETHKCSVCHAEFRMLKTVKMVGAPKCRECYAKCTCPCTKCGKIIHRSRPVSDTERSKILCKHCWQNNYPSLETLN